MSCLGDEQRLASSVKKAEDRRLRFSNKHHKFMDVQNSNFAPNISPKWGSSAPNFAFLNDNFATRRRFFDNFLTAKNSGWTSSLPLRPRGTTPSVESRLHDLRRNWFARATVDSGKCHFLLVVNETLTLGLDLLLLAGTQRRQLADQFTVLVASLHLLLTNALQVCYTDRHTREQKCLNYASAVIKADVVIRVL